MRERTEPNPYVGASVDRLQQRCMEAIGELDRRATRTPEEKRAFAKELRWLLSALGHRIHGIGKTVPGAPERALQNEFNSLSKEFWGLYENSRMHAERAARRETVYRAAEFVLGMPKAEYWLIPSVAPTAYRPLDHAERSDDGLRKVLLDLEALFEAKKRGDQGAPPETGS